MNAERLVVLLLALLAACTGEPPPPSDATVLTGVSVIDVRTGTIADDQTIVIRDGRIDYVGDPPPARELAGATVHEHTGRYVMPGLWDMHVHLRNGPDSDLADENEIWLRQYLGFGVTAVRDAGGDLPEQVRSWRDGIERGEQWGPRIFTSLQKLEGPTGGWEGSIRLTSLADVVPAIDLLTESGADFIKLYDASIAADVYLAAVAEAQRRGLKTAGHLPLTVMFEAAIEAGLDSVEHESYLAKAASTEEAAIAAEIEKKFGRDEAYSFYAMLARLQASASPERLEQVLDTMIRHGAALTPTLHIGHVLDTMTDPSAYEQDPQLAQVPPGLRETFQLRVNSLVRRTPELVARDLDIMARNRAFVQTAADRGVTILAGSDTGAVNSYVYPGDSLHRELAELVEVGLTPLQALQGATLDAAAWLERADDFGTVEVGRIADLLVLEANPLLNIGNTRSIVAVLQEGRYLDSDTLADLRTLPTTAR
ncbi:MAG: amidohydrolase family protein [Pseudomonadales bacterium]